MKRPAFTSSFAGMLLAAFFLAFVNGCALAPVAGIGGTGIAAELYILSHPDSITKTAAAIGKTFKDITPEQEYYIGRAVTATVLKHYPPYNNERANRYINLLGQSLAQASTRPETFGGYHFLILDSEEINAFAAPGGLILVTRGMLRLCKTEDEAAAVLAHEISHIEYQHGLSAIQQSRIVSALGVVASEGAKAVSAGQSQVLFEAFEGVVGDVASNLLYSGYSREHERQADRSTVSLLRRVGYDPRALINVLRALDKHIDKAGPRFTRTHPDTEERIRSIKSGMGLATEVADFPKRRARFTRFIAGV